jgi:hypothetical protein
VPTADPACPTCLAVGLQGLVTEQALRNVVNNTVQLPNITVRVADSHVHATALQAFRITIGSKEDLTYAQHSCGLSASPLNLAQHGVTAIASSVLVVCVCSGAWAVSSALLSCCFVVPRDALKVASFPFNGPLSAASEADTWVYLTYYFENERVQVVRRHSVTRSCHVYVWLRSWPMTILWWRWLVVCAQNVATEEEKRVQAGLNTSIEISVEAGASCKI